MSVSRPKLRKCREIAFMAAETKRQISAQGSHSASLLAQFRATKRVNRRTFRDNSPSGGKVSVWSDWVVDLRRLELRASHAVHANRSSTRRQRPSRVEVFSCCFCPLEDLSHARKD